ncbi:16525_t:CDS:1, partial [Dentiscutata heterogama]
MMKLFIILFALIHVITSSSLNSLDNNNVNIVPQIVDLKSESTKTQSYADVDLDDNIAHETINKLDEQINGVVKYRWRCGACCRNERNF